MLKRSPSFNEYYDHVEKEMLRHYSMDEDRYEQNFFQKVEDLPGLKHVMEEMDWMLQTSLTGNFPFRMEPEDLPEEFTEGMVLNAFVFALRSHIEVSVSILSKYHKQDNLIVEKEDMESGQTLREINLDFWDEYDSVTLISRVEDYIKETGVDEEKLKYSIIENYLMAKEVHSENSEQFKQCIEKGFSFSRGLETLLLSMDFLESDIQEFYEKAKEALYDSRTLRESVEGV